MPSKHGMFFFELISSSLGIHIHQIFEHTASRQTSYGTSLCVFPQTVCVCICVYMCKWTWCALHAGAGGAVCGHFTWGEAENQL